MTLHIFNPEHDLALAANSPFWTSPKAGMKLRQDLAWLPALWAKPGDSVVVADVQKADSALSVVESVLEKVCNEVRFCTLSDIAKKTFSSTIDSVEVWGWDMSVVNQLTKAGVPRGLMPSCEILERQRALSDRATSAKLLEHLKNKFSGLCGDATAIYNINNVEEFQAEWGSVVLKSPWSSSGRGVQVWDESRSGIRSWAEKVIEKQGHIMVERFLDKEMDFAMEFTAESDGSVRYVGLSLFNTVGGAYTGNMLAPEDEKLKLLSSYVPERLLHDVADCICRWMEHTLSACYAGPFGVDMMIVRKPEGKGFLLDPCVEINLRRTMGHVALGISDAKGAKGKSMNVVFENGGYCFRIEKMYRFVVFI